jgi:hypothetical protein
MAVKVAFSRRNAMRPRRNASSGSGFLDSLISLASIANGLHFALIKGYRMLSLVLRFSGHQSFALRNTWLTKGVLTSAQNPRIFSEPDALVILGVGKNVVESIRYWCQAAQMVEDVPGARGAYQPSQWGRLFFCGESAWDPYLEDTATLWFVHWLLATNRACAGTTYAFNELPGSAHRRQGADLPRL